MVWIVAAEAVVIAIFGALLLVRRAWPGLLAWGVAVALWLWAARREPSLIGKTQPLPEPSPQAQSGRRSRWRLVLLGLCAVATAVNILYSRDNTFEAAGLVAWVVSVGALMAAFRDGPPPRFSPSRWGMDRNGWRIPWEGVALAGLLALGAFFRLWRLHQVPPEMTYDHGFNLLDLRELLRLPERPVFFPRNMGREPAFFYWAAAVIHLTGMEVGLDGLKLASALAGLLTLPGVYLLTREAYGRWVGFWAALFAAVASWPVILGRLGLRCCMAPLASAWALYFFVRGLRSGRRNDFLWLGLILGAGLYTYTAFRIVPLAVAAGWAAVWLAARGHNLGRRYRWENTGLTVLTALLVFVPLAGFALTYPESFWKRASWYLNQYPNIPRPGLVFLHNLVNLARMFHWRGDMVAVSTLPGQPVLDPILGGLLVLGTVIALGRVTRRRDRDALTLGLLVAGVISLLPSALVLSHPGENPSVMRTSSGIPVVFAVTALPIGLWTQGIWKASLRRGPRILAIAAVALLVIALIGVNHHRVFVRYAEAYRRAVVDISAVTSAIRSFEVVSGSAERVYAIACRGWLDPQIIAAELGVARWSNCLESAREAAAHPREAARIYILYPYDDENLQRLQELFPECRAHLYESPEDRDCILYICR